ncbi:diacylglycerol kinase family protein [Cytophagaceae bacterium ABcell3]|nr:diacylglycerol kinase family protein [Cytophagaceae bacterium ABcell3]
MKIIFAHNPTAGDGNLSESELKTLFGAGHDIDYYNVKEKTYHKIAEQKADCVVIAGGDGTVGKVSKTLIGREHPIYIIPSGTANNIAKCLGISFSKDKLKELDKHKSTISFDVGLVENNCERSHFIESIGFGLFSHMGSIVHKLKKENYITFPNAEEKIKFAVDMMKRLLKNYQPNQYHIKADGKEYSGTYLMVEIMNIASIGPNLNLAPKAKPDDGYFDLVLVKDSQKENLIKFLNSCLTTPCHDYLHIVKAKEIEIQCAYCEAHIDDTFIEKAPSCSNKNKNQISFSIRPQKRALTFLKNT